MDDHAGALLNHSRHKRAIQTYRREQVLIQRLVPFVVIQHGKAARRCRGPAHHMHEDVDAAETLTNRLRNDGAAFGGGDIGRDELLSLGEMSWPRPCGGEHGRACFPQRCHDCFADPLGAAGHERTFALQL